MLSRLNKEQVNFISSEISKQTRYKLIDVLMTTYDKYRFASSVASYFQICLLEMMDKCNEKTIETNQEIVKNVSRETFKKEEVSKTVVEKKEVKTEIKKESSIKPLKNEFVLSLLHGANKQEKDVDKNKMKTIEKYRLDINVARYVMMIKNTEIIASANTYIVVSTENQAQANEINELDQNEMFASFIKEWLGKTKKIFAVSKQHSEEIINEFRIRWKNKTLPAPIQFDIKEQKETKLEEKTQEELVIELFGKENVIVTEE